MKNLIVDKKYDNKKLNTFLMAKLPTLTNNLFYKTLRKKDIRINGKRINENVSVFEGDQILVYISDDILMPSINIDIFYEDDNILIINNQYNIEVSGENILK